MAKSESTKIEFGYFHDYESEQFAFYRIPKVLFTDEYFRNLSSDAKVLYGFDGRDGVIPDEYCTCKKKY